MGGAGRALTRRVLLTCASAWAAASLLPGGCDGPPPLEARLLCGYSKGRGEVVRLDLPRGATETALPPGACGDLARGARGEPYAAMGRELYELSSAGPRQLLQVEGRIDSVLASRDGKRLFLLEHPAGGGGHGDEGEAATAPHRLRVWDLAASRFEGETELSRLAYEIHEAPGLVLATQIQGRRIEIVPMPAGKQPPGSAEEMEVVDPALGPPNRQALLRTAAIEPGGRFALLVENGVEGDFERPRIWTMELRSRGLKAHAISARGIFQCGAAFLEPRGEETRVLLDGCDRVAVVRGGPERGFVVEASCPLPGLFPDLRVVGLREAAGPPRELVLLAGSDAARKRGYVVAVDPAAARVVYSWALPGPADLIEIERSR